MNLCFFKTSEGVGWLIVPSIDRVAVHPTQFVISNEK
jgi:hypothetical protein